METDRKKASQSFDHVAEGYDRYRPDYPQALVDSLITHTGLEPGGSILEVGSGTGKATALFAPFDFMITCLEPGQNLTAVAARRLAAYPKIQYRIERFENWDAPEEAFDLLYSAQAYHWVPEDVRMKKAAWVLKPGGHIALIYNMYPTIDSPVRRGIDKVYQQTAPEISKDKNDIEIRINQITQEIRESGFFNEPDVLRQPWSRILDVESYLGLMNTFSDHLQLPERTKKRLFTGVAEVIRAHGGEYEQHLLTVVHIARKRG